MDLVGSQLKGGVTAECCDLALSEEYSAFNLNSCVSWGGNRANLVIPLMTQSLLKVGLRRTALSSFLNLILSCLGTSLVFLLSLLIKET